MTASRRAVARATCGLVSVTASAAHTPAGFARVQQLLPAKPRRTDVVGIRRRTDLSGSSCGGSSSDKTVESVPRDLFECHWEPTVEDRIAKWGQLQPTAISLHDLCEIGLNRRRRREHGVFLHTELRIRLAQRLLELQSLPFGLAKRPGIRNVIRWYTDFLLDLDDEESPVRASQDEHFTNALSHIFENHAEVVQAMALGVQDLMIEVGEDYEDIQPQVDAALRRFFIARIGLRFLLQHHIESYRNREGHSGVLQLECSPADIARKAAKDSVRLCKEHLGQAPPIVFSEFPGPARFTYLPMHLQYILTEVFKNSCRAVVETHSDDFGFDDALPPVRVHIVHGHEDVTIRVSDEGGGISRPRMRDVWKFMYSTYKKSPWVDVKSKLGSRPAPGDSLSDPLQRQSPNRKGSTLAGYGVGLTLSRLYSQYFGGDMKILSMDGLGTDVYLQLPRLGHNCENLPKMVMVSPAMRDSTISDADYDLHNVLISAEEEAFLKRELARFRRNQDIE
eukprot:TRINITY_DN44685_c0_g1_i1.p1 TRINITY_DN44685_c0_g1~~TRINITY_DN44685_c0_g1_i1.p1  ORF type:complete len:507 (+),score=66.97 TRINITY_DN44685_c0_g1_i1:173-1693(+)